MRWVTRSGISGADSQMGRFGGSEHLASTKVNLAARGNMKLGVSKLNLSVLCGKGNFKPKLRKSWMQPMWTVMELSTKEFNPMLSRWTRNRSAGEIFDGTEACDKEADKGKFIPHMGFSVDVRRSQFLQLQESMQMQVFLVSKPMHLPGANKCHSASNAYHHCKHLMKNGKR